MRSSIRFKRIPARRIDADNVNKPTLDALKGVAYDDDAQVRHASARLLDGAIDATVIGRVELLQRLPGCGSRISPWPRCYFFALFVIVLAVTAVQTQSGCEQPAAPDRVVDPPLEPATTGDSPTRPSEVTMPIEIVEQLYEQLQRLEVLERPEQMRIVRRQQAQLDD